MHVRRTAAAIAATGLTAALLPLAAGSAQADPSGPSFGYVTYAVNGVHTATTDKLWATTPGNLSASTALTPDHHVYRYDVSADGNVLVTSGRSRSFAVPRLNTTYGLLLTVRDPLDSASVTTTPLASWFDSNPDVLPDGSRVYWLDRAVILKHDVASGVTERASGRFGPKPGEEVMRLAVSPDGTKAAVIYGTFDLDGNLTATRIKAALLANAGPVFEKSVAVTATSSFPVPGILTWKPDSSGFLYSRSDVDGDLVTVSAAIGGAATTVTALAGAYDLNNLDGTWYSFRENGNPAVTQVGSAATLTTPSDFTTFPLGAVSVRYTPSTLTPPVEVTPSSRATSKAALFFGDTSLTWGQKTVYASLATYLYDPAGEHSSDDQFVTRYGVLSMSTDGGATYSVVGRTGLTGSYLPWPNAAPFGNGYTPVVTRNTVFKWCFEGDVYVARSCTTRKIAVAPKVTANVSRSSGLTRVYGSATRIGGYAVLQKVPSGFGWPTTVARTTISGGKYSFSARKLAPGVYRVVTTADAGWASGSKKFAVS
jgi:hypothetical protein